MAQHLRAWIDYSRVDAELSFWRTSSGSEVDLVAYGADVFHAIEVKHTAEVRPADLRALRSFRADYPEAKLRLLHRGRETLEIDGIRCIPAATFLRQLVPGRPLP